MSLDALKHLPEDTLKEILELTEAKARLELREKASEKFMPFVHHVYDNFVEGRHHRIIAEKLERVARGELKRLIINMPPRHSKSEFASYLMPAWFLGRNPKLKVIQATHNTELAVRFGRKVRDLIDDPRYQEIFPDTILKEDNKGAGKWGTTQGAEYFAAGVGAAVTGRGADLFIIDDPHSEQDALSETAFDHAYEWYTSGPRQRLQPGAAIILVMTRWGAKDLTGRLLAQQGADVMSDQWEVVEFPAIMPSGEPLWPEFWQKDALLSIKASLPVTKWSAQWQQQPTSSESAIIKREWWRMWEKKKIPPVKYILQAYDTAFSKKETADYSAITTWGIFDDEETGREAIILMDAQRGRWNFPELKEVAFEEHQYWEPDMVIVEKKASGGPLIDEMRKRGIPALGFSPGKRAGGGGVDKVTRMHLVSPLFESGVVWAPQDKKFADEVIEEVASFPVGEHDDFCFVGDTLITMEEGLQKPIREVQVGDRVWTPAGLKPVLSAGCTGIHPTFRLRAGAHALEGTGNHPIATTRGWKRLDTISLSDTIKVSQRTGVKWRIQTKLEWLLSVFISTTENITDTLSRRTRICENIFGAGEAEGLAFTAPSGSTTMVLSQRTTTSITLMGMWTTMTSPILSACREWTILPYTPKTGGPTGLSQNNLNIWLGSGRKQLTGTAQRRVGSGIERLVPRRWRRAALLTKQGKDKLPSKKQTLLQRFARSVAKSFRRLRAGLQSAAMRAQVESLVESGEKKPVYNLTVADAHCYYANGVLVHNCDSMTLALMRFRQGGLISIGADEEDNDVIVVPRRREYY